MLLTFDADHVRKLLDLGRDLVERMPTHAQFYDPAFWRDDLAAGRRAELEAQIAEHGIATSTKLDDIDRTKIPHGLILVGDEGVYIMSQAGKEACDAAGVPHVCYAKECDPVQMAFNDWWEAKRQSFGGDDGTEFLAAENVEQGLKGGRFVIDITPEEISIMIADFNAPSQDDPAP